MYDMHCVMHNFAVDVLNLYSSSTASTFSKLPSKAAAAALAAAKTGSKALQLLGLKSKESSPVTAPVSKGASPDVKELQPALHPPT